MKIKSIFLSLLFSMLCLTSVQKMPAISFSTIAGSVSTAAKDIFFYSVLGNLPNYYRVLTQGCIKQSRESAMSTIGLYSMYGTAAGIGLNVLEACYQMKCTCKKTKCDCESNRVKAMGKNVLNSFVLAGSAYLMHKLRGNN